RLQAGTGEVRGIDPRPGGPGPGRRGNRDPGHPTPLPPGDRPLAAGPVLLPVGVPLHHRLQQRHRPRARVGLGGLHRRRDRPAGPGRGLAAVGDRSAPANQGRLPYRHRHHRPGRLRGQPAGRRERGGPAVPAPAALPGTTQAGSAARKNTVNTGLTPKRPRLVVENDAYAAFAHRILTAYARRIAGGDLESLSLLTALSADIDTAIGQAITGLRAFGYSWADIAARLGVTRQAAQQRWRA